MPVGAVVGVGLLSAGTSVAAAKMGSSAAKNAAKTQAASADKAQGFNQQAFDYQKQITNPYIQNGQTSLANLMAQHWGGQPSQYGLPQPQAPQGGLHPGGALRGGLGNFAQPQPPQGPPQGGGMVNMRGPDGSMRPVPQQLVQKYLSKGASVVN